MPEHTVFTDFILSGDLENSDPDKVFDEIRRVLKIQLKRRALWRMSPSILGYEGSSWSDLETLQSLTYDCFVHIFIGVSKKNPGGKWDYWRRKVEMGERIEKQIYSSIKHFLHDLQQNSSPEDTAIYKNLRKALEALLEEPGGLEVLGGDPQKIQGKTLFGTTSSGTDPIQIDALGQFLEVNPDWQAALGIVRKFSKKATDLAKRAINSTVDADQIPFLFGDLKHVVSERSYFLLENNAHEIAPEFLDPERRNPDFIRIWRDEDSYKQKEERFTDFVELIHQKINSLNRRELIKQRLHEIVDCYASKLRASAFDDSISQSTISEELKIAKQTLSDYMSTIREIALDLQASGDS